MAARSLSSHRRRRTPQQHSFQRSDDVAETPRQLAARVRFSIRNRPRAPVQSVTEMIAMTIALKPELEKYVEEQVRAGRFASHAEVLEAGLEMLMLEPDLSIDDEEWAIIEQAEKDIAEGKTFTLAEVRAEIERDFPAVKK
jgi:putative addiction module CopG family antidote